MASVYGRQDASVSRARSRGSLGNSLSLWVVDIDLVCGFWVCVLFFRKLVDDFILRTREPCIVDFLLWRGSFVKRENIFRNALFPALALLLLAGLSCFLFKISSESPHCGSVV